MLMQSGGCCDGSSPICLHAGELLVGPNDLLLGEVGGAPFYIDAEQYERWRSPRLVLDVAPGGGDAFSLEGLRRNPLRRTHRDNSVSLGLLHEARPARYGRLRGARSNRGSRWLTT